MPAIAPAHAAAHLLLAAVLSAPPPVTDPAPTQAQDGEVESFRLGRRLRGSSEEQPVPKEDAPVVELEQPAHSHPRPHPYAPPCNFTTGC